MAAVNLWNRPNVPHKNWCWLDVIDTQTRDSVCDMCGNERIRYVHVMAHPEYPAQLSVGCVCAEKMTNDYVNPKQRERKLRNAAASRTREAKRERERKDDRRRQITEASWQYSKNGNLYMRVYLEYAHARRKVHAVIVKSKFNCVWAFSINGEFSAYKYATIDAAKIAAKEALLRKFTL